jgi:ATP-dependent DNA helicase RecQ
LRLARRHERLAERLAAAGVPAIAYHAGLDARDRDRRLEKFLRPRTAVMVATIAFGMGVDKPDVRFVIHADPPASIEAYWQEIGRAGRDGEPADGITLYGPSDIAWALRRLAGRPWSARRSRQVQVRKAAPAVRHAGRGLLPRPAVRRYFGEEGAEACGVCDLCLDPRRRSIDATVPAQKALAPCTAWAAGSARPG